MPSSGRFRAAQCVVPTAETESGRWFGKLRRRNGAALALIFHKPRAQWPGRNRTQALLILRAGNVLPTSRGNLRKMGSRGGEYEREALILSRALAPLWFLSGRPERNPPRRAELPCRPQAAKSPLQGTKPLCHRPPHPSRLRRATFPPRGRLFLGGLIQPLDKGSRSPGGRLWRRPGVPPLRRKRALPGEE